MNTGAANERIVQRTSAINWVNAGALMGPALRAKVGTATGRPRTQRYHVKVHLGFRGGPFHFRLSYLAVSMRHVLTMAGAVLVLQAAGARPLLFQHLSTANGFTDNSITALHQDRDGFLWVGTENGLNRYDGQHVWTWQHHEGTDASFVTGITQARDGRIYACYGEGAVAVFNSHGMLEHVYHALPQPIHFTCVYDLNDTTLLVGGRIIPLSFMDKRSGRFTFWNGTGPVHPALARTSLPDSIGPWCHYLLPVDGQRFAIGFLHYFKQVMVDRNSGRILGRTFTEFPGDQTISSALVMDQRMIGAGWQHRLHLHALADGAGTDAAVAVPDECTALADAGSGMLWAGTRSMGLLQVDPATGQWHQFRHRPYDLRSLADDRVQALLVDRDGQLWVGTRQGLDMAAPGRELYEAVPIRADDLPDLQDTRIIALPGHPLMIGTTEGVYVRQAGSFKHHPLTCGTRRLKVNTVVPYGDQYLVGAEEGIYTWNGKGDRADALGTGWTPRNASTSTKEDGNLPDLFQVRSILLDTLHGQPVVILGVLGYGMVIMDPAKRELWDCAFRPDEPASLGNNLVRMMVRASDGQTWLATQGGLYRWTGRGLSDPNRFQAFRNDADEGALPGNDVLALLADAAGGVWAGLRNGRLVHWDGRSMRQIPCTDAACSRIHALLHDGQGRIWCATHGGFNVYDPRNGSWAHLPIPSATTSETVPHAPAPMEDGTIAFASGNSLLLLDPASTPQVTPVPLPYLIGLQVDGKPGPTDLAAGALSLAVNQMILEVQLSALSLSMPGGLRFTLRLDGVDPGPRPTNADGSLSYAGMPPGTHALWAQAISPDGRMSPPVLVATIIKAAPYWQRPWFYLLVALFAGAVAYAIARSRYRQRLEVQAVRNRIADDLHDEVGSSLSSITLGSQLARQLSDGRNEQITEILTRIGEASSTSMRNISDIVWAIDPKNDQGRFLVKRMQRTADELLSSKGVEVEYRTGRDLEELKLSMALRKELLLIFKEAAHNASKHSGATHVRISLESAGNRLTMGLSDNGRGFDTRLYRDGHGLGSMRRRSDALGARFTLRSSPGQGTSILVDVPLGG